MSEVDQGEVNVDAVIILSSEKIAEVMEVHFNKVMLRQAVKVISVEAAGEGYSFALTYVQKVMSKPSSVTETLTGYPLADYNERLLTSMSTTKAQRSSNGKFTKKEKV